MKRVEDYIILTHATLMKGKNLQGVIAIMSIFNNYPLSKAEFWRKLENLLEK